MKAKKSLGQNFLMDKNIIKRIVDLVDAKENDLVLEIGPGRGALTKELVNKDFQFVAIELDHDMDEYLNKLNAQIIYEDILKVDLLNILKDYQYDKLYVVGNLPYYITSPILERLVQMEIKPDKMIFMVQKEVAVRYASKEGSSDYGFMSLFLQFYYDLKEELFVHKKAFLPVPKVDSEVISLSKKKEYPDVDFNKFMKFLKKAFQFKRKTLKNNLREFDWDIIKQVLIENGLSEDVRSESISREIFVKIYNSLK